MTHTPLRLLYLPPGVTREQVQSDPSVPIVMTNTRRMAKFIAAQGQVACVVTDLSDSELAVWLKRKNAAVGILPKGGLPM